MLSAAEADLVRRDTAVPGLATALDPEAFLAALRRVVPAADVRGADITYVRLKPRSYARVSYRVDVGGTAVDVDVRASQEGDFARLLQSNDEFVGGPLGAGRIVLEDRSMVMTVFPNDPKAPELP